MSDQINVQGEDLELPRYAELGLLLLAIILMAFSFGIMVTYAVNGEQYKHLAPSNFPLDFLIALSLCIFVILYFPWSRIKVGPVELE